MRDGRVAAFSGTWHRRQELLLSVALVLLACALIVSLFPDAFGPSLSPRYIDEWVYVGMGDDFWSTTLEDYKLSRFTWLLPLALTERFLPVVSGYLALQAACLAVGGVSALFFLRRIVRPPLALGASIFAVLCWSVVAVGGATYHNTIALPLVATSIFAVVWAADRGSLGGWIFAGAILALLVHANLLALFMTPYFVVLYLGWLWARRRPMLISWSKTVGGLIGGSVGVTILLGFVAMACGQSFLFWWTGLQTAVGASTAQGTWYLPLFGPWLAHATYLFLPAIAALGSLVFLIGGWTRARVPRSPVVPVAVGFLVLASTWVLLQAIGVLALQPDYFAIQLQYPALIAIASLLGCRSLTPLAASDARQPRRGGESTSRLLLVGLSVAALIIGLLLWRFEFVPVAWFDPSMIWALVAVAGLAVGLASWLPDGRAAWALLPAAGLVIVALVLTTPADRSAAFVANCRGSGIAALPVVRAARGAIADQAVRAATRGGQVAVVVSGSILQASQADADRIRAAAPFDYLTGPADDKARCVRGIGTALPSAVVNTIYAQWGNVWFVPIAKGASGAEAIAHQWDLAGLAAGDYPALVIAPSAAEAARLEGQFLAHMPPGSRAERVKYEEPPYALYLSTLHLPSA